MILASSGVTAMKFALHVASLNFPEAAGAARVARAAEAAGFDSVLAIDRVILAQREPLALAKQVATLDFMYGGRIELGIGVGWLKEEFASIGVPFENAVSALMSISAPCARYGPAMGRVITAHSSISIR
jgi:alkanesulfonate monooxygenase SsuD/methylene tetrahydromethanopterin reductase-like flavin-dependent oxidoreductase (luciferase family)